MKEKMTTPLHINALKKAATRFLTHYHAKNRQTDRWELINSAWELMTRYDLFNTTPPEHLIHKCYQCMINHMTRQYRTYLTDPPVFYDIDGYDYEAGYEPNLVDLQDEVLHLTAGLSSDELSLLKSRFVDDKPYKQMGLDRGISTGGNLCMQIKNILNKIRAGA